MYHQAVREETLADTFACTYHTKISVFCMINIIFFSVYISNEKLVDPAPSMSREVGMESGKVQPSKAISCHFIDQRT